MRLPLSLTLAMMMALAGCRAAGPASARGDQGASASRELISTVTGDPPNFAQMANGELMTVVSRPFGRGAKAGALVELYWPNYATDHLWDAYVGVAGPDGKPTWAHDLKLVKQALVPDTGRAVAVFAGTGFTLTIEDVVAPGADVHLRKATLKNTGGAPLAGRSLAHFGFFTVDHLPAGDKARFEDGVLVQSDAATTVAVAADVAPDATRVGLANIPLGSARDARMAVEGGDWKGPATAGPAVAGVDAVSRHPLPTLAPGAEAAVTWAIAIGTGAEGPKATAQAAARAGFAAAAQADAQKWGAFLAAGREPAGLTQAAKQVYRRAMLTLGQHQTADGAIIAAPTNLNPPYRFVWPRDGSIIALTLLQAGHRAAAERFIAFAEKLQRPDGSFAINYFPDGAKALWDFGAAGNEHDQPGTIVWAIDKIHRQTGDDAWLRARWNTVRKGCDFLVAVQEPSGLLSRCRDLWELDADGSWTYSNGAAHAGLVAGAAIAEKLGEADKAQRWRAAAAKLKDAIADKLMTGGATGWLGRGLRGDRVDPTVEAANLALGAGGFNVFKDSDPQILGTGKAVVDRLSMPGGGIRRYENDRYYDGQPWPVSTAWLATHKLALGDRAAAQAGLDTMTRWAGETDALMLGEQFDEKTRRWASAFPLAWSEAVYVRLALDLAK